MTNHMDLQATWKAKLFIALPASELLLFVYVHMILTSTQGFKPFLTVTAPEYSLMKISVMIVSVPHRTKSTCTRDYNALVMISMFISLQSMYSDPEHRAFSANMNLLRSGSSA